jgi:hypothetical protein
VSFSAASISSSFRIVGPILIHSLAIPVESSATLPQPEKFIGKEVIRFNGKDVNVPGDPNVESAACVHSKIGCRTCGTDDDWEARIEFPCQINGMLGYPRHERPIRHR